MDRVVNIWGKNFHGEYDDWDDYIEPLSESEDCLFENINFDLIWKISWLTKEHIKNVNISLLKSNIDNKTTSNLILLKDKILSILENNNDKIDYKEISISYRKFFDNYILNEEK